MVVLSWSASPEQLWSWGDAASEDKVALQRQIQVCSGAMSAHLFGEGMKGMVKGSGGSPRGFPVSHVVLTVWPLCTGCAAMALVAKRGLWVPPPEAADWG